MCPSGNVGCATSFRSVQLSKIKVYGLRLSPAHLLTPQGSRLEDFLTLSPAHLLTPQGLGRAADSVPLNADGHMSPHLSSEDFCLRFASGMAELLLTAWISPLILLARKNFSDFFTVSLFHVNRSPFHGILDGASQCLLQMRMSTQPVEHPFLQ